MRTRTFFLALPFALLSAGAACAAPLATTPAELYALAKTNNCMACHTVDKKLVGPSFQAIGKQYAGQPDAAEKLAVKIAKGGSGSWGAIPMPANGQVTPEEMPLLVNWILAGAPTQ